MKYQKYSKDVMDIREFIDKVNATGKMLKEGYDFQPETEDVVSSEEIVTSDEEPVGNFSDDKTEATGMQYVDQIRKAAIEGIEAFVDNVDSPSYDFFKKVFMMADKVLSQDNNNEE